MSWGTEGQLLADLVRSALATPTCNERAASLRIEPFVDGSQRDGLIRSGKFQEEFAGVFRANSDSPSSDR